LKYRKDGEGTPDRTSKFEVALENGDVLFSKIDTSRFPNDDDFKEICAKIDKQLK